MIMSAGEVTLPRRCVSFSGFKAMIPANPKKKTEYENWAQTRGEKSKKKGSVVAVNNGAKAISKEVLAVRGMATQGPIDK